MPNLNQLVLTASDYKVLIIIPTGLGTSLTFPMLTADMIEWTNASENEDIYAIGIEDPVGNKSNANKYSGKFSLQNGELSAMLQLCGMKTAIQIRNATLAITAIIGGYSKVYSGLNVNSEGNSVKAKDKQSIVSLDWNAISIT